MQVAHELGIDEEVVLNWPKAKFERWVAYFHVSHERSKQK